MPTWILIVQFLTRGILVLLVLLSIWSIAVVIERRRYFRDQLKKVESDPLKEPLLPGAKIAEFFNQSAADSQADSLPWVKVWGFLQSSIKNKKPHDSLAEATESLYRYWILENRREWDRGLGLLATLGSTAPFIGLLGTVLGIIQAFGELARNAGAGTEAVMAGISEALVATAIGLAVAIPAVIAYNFYSKKVKELIQRCDQAKQLYLGTEVYGRKD